MTTITLKHAASYDANGIHLMTARPQNINIANLNGGAIQFSCSNPLAALQGATSVDITYDAAHGSGHQNVPIGSIMS
ncbi:hypothetical protein ACXZ1M_29005 [Duganella sp. PWIR1]|jgi:hypothetical protein